MIKGKTMGKIFKSKIEKVLFVSALLIALVTGIFAGANASLGKNWVNKDYEDYKNEPDRYTVTEVPIKEFKTLNGTNCKALTLLDLYRVCTVDVTFAGGQNMEFYIPRSSTDKIGDRVKVAYEKHWDTNYDKVMKDSDIDKDSTLEAARTEEVKDGTYARLFGLMSFTSVLFAVAVFVICYKKKDAYEF